MSDYPVTEKAMRPASDERRCFYCHCAIGDRHTDDCVLLKRAVRLRVTIELSVQEPASWDQRMIEFHYNDSSYCKDNILDEIQRQIGDGCLCGTPFVDSEIRVLEIDTEIRMEES